MAIKNQFYNKLSFIDNKKQIESPSYISAIVQSDKELLQKAVLKFRSHSINYEDSWGYVIQATRYGQFKWYDKSTGSLIFFGRKSDTDNTLVVATFFCELAYLKDALDRILRIENGSKAIIKNVTPQDVVKFVAYGFRPYKEDEQWLEEAPYDDQTYPQLVIGLQELTEMKRKPYRNLRTCLRKANQLNFREYMESDKNQVLDIFALRDNIISKDLNLRLKGMYYASHEMYPSSNIDKYVITDNQTNEVLGFTAASDISPISTALVASIFRPSSKIESIWGMYQSMLVKYNQGFPKINIGGCETEGTFNFLRRTFRPIEKLEKTHLIYD